MNALALVTRCYRSDEIVSRSVVCPTYYFNIYVSALLCKDAILCKEGDTKDKVGLAIFIGLLFFQFNRVCGPEEII